MRPDQCALLQRIAQGDGNFGNDNFKDPSARSQFARMIERLQELESAGWITLTAKRAERHRDKPWYDASALITEEGEQALAESCAEETPPRPPGEKVKIGEKRKAPGAKDPL